LFWVGLQIQRVYNYLSVYMCIVCVCCRSYSTAFCMCLVLLCTVVSPVSWGFIVFEVRREIKKRQPLSVAMLRPYHDASNNLLPSTAKCATRRDRQRCRRTCTDDSTATPHLDRRAPDAARGRSETSDWACATDNKNIEKDWD
jgi:hypothetical protein